MTKNNKKTRINKRSGERLHRSEIIRNKLNREPLDVTEVCEILYTNKSSFDQHMAKFCDLYPFEINDFKEGKRYVFPREWHGLFLALFGSLDSHPMFHKDKAKQERNHRTLNEHLSKLNSLMRDYVPEVQRNEIIQDYTYIRTNTELRLVTEIEKKLNKSFALIQMMPTPLRFSTLAEINNALDTWLLRLAQSQATYHLERAFELRDCDEEVREQKELEHMEFDSALASYLKKAIQAQKQKKQEKASLDETELDRLFSAILDELLLARLQSQNDELGRLSKEMQQIIFEQTTNEEILQTVQEALEHRDDTKSSLVLEWIKKVLLILQVADKNSNSTPGKSQQLQKAALYTNAFQGLNDSLQK